LFANGEQGAWYDPSSMDTLFQDSAGTTPVTAVEQPVGLMLDKSKGLVLGPELVTNGDFSAGTTGWTLGATWSVSSGVASKAAGDTSSIFRDIPALTAGTSYVVELDQTYTVGPFSLLLRVGSGGVVAYNASLPAIQGRVRIIVNAAAAATRLSISHVNFTATGSIDNISVRELPGNHAFQSTAASRPVLSARVNLLTKTEDFADSVWVKSNATVTANAATAPDGTTTADLVYPSSTGSLRQLYDGNQTLNGTSRLSLRVKSAGFRWMYLFYTAGVANPTTGCFFDVIDGVIGGNGSGSGAVYNEQITPIGDGWFQISVDIDNAQSSRRCCIGLSDANNSYTATRDGTSGIYIWGADLRVANDGVGLPAYQRVNTSTDYDTTGFPMYLRFDGVDDGMVTNSINFTSTDKMTVFAGVRKLSDAATALLAELSVSTDTNAGAFYVGAPSSGGNTKFSFNSRGSVLPATPAGTASATYSAPVSAVVAAIGSISEDIRTLRLNSTVVATGGGVDQGTGNFGNYPLYIGRRGGTTLPFNGRLHSLIVRGAQSTTQQIEQTEAYVNARTKAY
jgi:hypothetical protein